MVFIVSTPLSPGGGAVQAVPGPPPPSLGNTPAGHMSLFTMPHLLLLTCALHAFAHAQPGYLADDSKVCVRVSVFVAGAFPSTSLLSLSLSVSQVAAGSLTARGLLKPPALSREREGEIAGYRDKRR